MKISDIKQAMKSYSDFYGGDISDTARIDKAKTKKELAEILMDHENYMEDMLSDAKVHLTNFRRRIGLF